MSRASSDLTAPFFDKEGPGGIWFYRRSSMPGALAFTLHSLSTDCLETTSGQGKQAAGSNPSASQLKRVLEAKGVNV